MSAMADLDHTVRRLVLSEVARRHLADWTTAIRLRATPGKEIYAPLFDRAMRFWHHLDRVLRGWELPDADDAFVIRYLREPIERKVIAERGRAATR